MPTLSELPIGAILAGGRATRMGVDKALVRFEGRPMIEHVASAIVAAGYEPLVVGRESAPGGLEAVPDDVGTTQGPAGGLATALRIAGGRPVILVATDQPLLRPETLRALLRLDGIAVVPVDLKTRQTTCSIYRSDMAEPLLALMANHPRPSLQRLLNGVSVREVPPTEWRQWGEDGRSWRSLDTPDAVTEAERWLRATEGAQAQD